MPLRLRVILSLALALSATAAARAEQLGDGWTYRRAITFKQIPSDPPGAPGDNVAWVEFYLTPGHRADGADIRVTTPTREIVPHKIMRISPGDDLARVAFATKGDGPYYLWWGHDAAQKPAQELDIRRGIFMETSRGRPSSIPGRALATRPTLAAADTQNETETLNAAFIPDLGIAYNTRPDILQFTTRYTGTFKIDPAITAQFQLSANGSESIAIDGQPLPIRRASPVTLSAGWHTLEISQTNPPGGNPTLALTWQRPGDKSFSPFPTSLFAKAARGVAEPLEKVGTASPPLDITVQAVAEIPLGTAGFAQRFTLEAIAPENRRPTFSWQFDDGQTSTLRRVNHIFFTTGVHPVVLTVTYADGTKDSTALRIPVLHRMYDRLPKPPVDPPQTVLAVLRDYNLTTLTPEDAFMGMQYFAAGKDDEARLMFGAAWLSKIEMKTVPTETQVLNESLALSRILLRNKQAHHAADLLYVAAIKPVALETRLELVRQAVYLWCDNANDPLTAVDAGREWAARAAQGRATHRRLANVALAHALIALEKGDEAKAALDIANTPPAPAADANAYNQLRAKVEDTLKKKDLDTAAAMIAEWELQNPLSLWDGSSRLLRVRLAEADARPADAARLARQHALANPASAAAAELLHRAAELYKSANQEAPAREMLDLLRTRYPNSPFVKQSAIPL